MSRVVDERVLSMQFDNKQFESNVATSMGTLEKLKRSLNLSGASKGLENVNTAARKCNLSPLSNAAETVGLKFNAMYTIADQSLRNMVNSAMAASKKIVSAFTIDPVKTGFQEYETQINSVQTILANTESKGSTLDDVNAALDELNTYADKTIYNFTEMTRNIGTFTAAGVDLDKSVTSIKGIANLAAVSGSTSQQASTAMYQLSQALAAGTVKLMDWNSVVNAGMGGEVFQTALKRTATQMGYNVDAMIKKYGSFRESLTQGEWLTAEVLTETLTQLSGAYTEADLIAQGYSESQAAEITKLADTAVNAATKVKTFTQLMDTLKEAAQSGWTQSWELIIGDFEEAKMMWSGVSETLGGIIDNMSRSRNEVLGGALKSNYDDFIATVNEAGMSTTEFNEQLSTVLKSHGYDVDMILEKYGSFEKALKAGAFPAANLREAIDDLGASMVDLSKVEAGLKKGSRGDQVKKVQEALKGLGHDLGKWGVDGIIGAQTEAAIKEFQELNGLKVTGIIDEETLAALEKASKATGDLKQKLHEMIDGVDELGGRDLLLKSFKNLWEALVKPIKAVGEAWDNVFGMSAEDKSARLFGIIKGFESFTEKLIISGDSAEKITKIFSGLFSAIKLGAGFVGGGFKMAFTALSAVLENFDMNILDVLAAIGDFFTKAYKWVDENNIIGESIVFVIGMLMMGVEKIQEWYNAFMALPGVQEKIAAIRDAFAGIGDYFGGGIKKIQEFWESLKGPNWKLFFDDGELGKAFRKALFDNFKTNVLGYFSDIGSKISEFVAKIIAPLSQLRDSAGEYLSATGDRFQELRDKISGFFTAIKEKLGDNMGSILAIGTLLSLLFIIKKIKDAVELIAKPFDIIDDFLGGLNKSIKKFASATAIKSIATSIAVLAASVAVLAMLDQKKVWSAVGAIVVLGTGLIIMSKLMGKIDVKELGKMTGALAGLAGAFLLMAIAVKIIGGMDGEALLKGGGAIAVFIGVVALMGKMSNSLGKGTVAFGKMMLQLAGALLILAFVTKIFGSMDTDTLLKGGTAVVTFLLTMTLIMKMTRTIGKNTAAFGSMMAKLGISLLLMAVAVKMLGSMDTGTMVKGGIAIATFLGMMVGMMAATKLLEKDLPKFGATMTGISVGLLSIAIAIKVLAGIDTGDIVKGGIVIAALLGMMVGMMAATKLLGKYSFNAAKVGVMMLSFSGAILILTGAIAVLSMIDASGLKRAVTAIGFISAIFAGLLFVTKFAKSVKVGTIVALSVAVGILAASIAALSFIDGSKLASATGSLSVIIGVFALLAASTKFVNNKAILTLGVMTLVVGSLAFMLYKLSELPAESSLAMATALSKLILALSASCILLAGVGMIGPKALIGVGVLAALLAVIGIALAIGIASLPAIGDKLAKFAENLKPFIEVIKDIDPALQSGMKTLAETILLLSGAGILDMFTGGKSLSKFGEQLKPFAEGLAEFSSVVSGKDFNPSAISDAAGAAKSLAELANSIPNQPGWIQKLFFGEKDLGTFGDQLKGFGEGLSEFSNSVSGTNFDAAAVSSAATATVALVELANSIPDNEGAWVAKLFIGHKDLSNFGTQLKGLGEGLGEFSTAVSGKNFDAAAITSAAEAASGLAELSTKIPDNTGAWVSKLFIGHKDLSNFGTQLKGLGEGLVAFSESVTGKSFDAAAVTSAANATAALADLAAKIPDNEGAWVSKLFIGHKDLSTFGTQLKGLGAGIVAFSESVTGKTFDATAVTSAAQATAALAEVAATIPDNEGAWVSKLFVGHKDLSTFGTQLKGLGSGIVAFSESVTGKSFDAAAVSSAAGAVSSLAEVAAIIPDNDGAWVSKLFVGGKDLSTFGSQLKGLGDGIVAFSDTITGKTIDATAISSAAKAATGLAELANAIPDNEGAWISKLFVGGKDLSTFGTQLSGFGTGLASFSESVTGKSFDADAVTSAAGAAAALVDLANELPEDQSWIEKFFFGDDSISSFGNKLVNFAQGLTGFSDEVTGLDTTSMSAAATAASILVGISETIGEGGTDNLADLGGNILSFGKQMGQFSDEISTLDALKIAVVVSSVKSIVELSDKVKTLDFSGLSSLSDSLSTIGTDAVDKFVGAFKNAGPKVQAAATVMITMLKTGLTRGMTQIPAVLNVGITYAVASIKGKWSAFYDAGKFLVSGFTSGISANAFRAAAAAKAMADAAYQAAKSALAINSPSKIFRSLGTSVPEGFAMGIGMLGSMVRKSSVSMADTAIDSTRNAISRIADVINSDIDAQPTIRPVVDLSDVRSGANAIGGMFGINPSVGVLSNVGTINSMMNARVQNGSNSDVISAINDLGKKLGNSTGDTYNVNGVTYDDGSNIVDAVKTLVRAAKVERRV